MKYLVRYGLYPATIFGFGGAGLYLIWRNAPYLHAWLALLLIGAIVIVLVAERVVPYNPGWNRSQGDVCRDALHALVNELSIVLSVFLLPVLAALIPWGSYWPYEWPFVLQVLSSVLVLDFGISLTHYFSHKYVWLWRFHAVHHSVKRMYGFNGLMKHPVHQAIELGVGILPLLLLGIPVSIALGLGFLTALQLLMQHTNADIRLGPFRAIVAAAEGHRFHHLKWPRVGDVNFGLFTLLWDHLLGTFHYEKRAPLSSDELGIAALPDYPAAYGRQLLEPFRPLP